MVDTVIIEERYRGPPTSGNGGYSCGLLARHLGDNAKIRLHSPPPLNTPLSILYTDDGCELRYLEDLVLSGKRTDLAMEIPDLPTITEAKQAQASFIGFKDHIFPDCFVCGPNRVEGDGLRIFPGLLDDRELFACIWQPDIDFYDDGGILKSEFIWAALDCPTYFGSVGCSQPKALLGEQELKIVDFVSTQAPLVISSWKIAEDGRKLIGGAALSTEQGELLAYSKGLWILLA